MNQSFNKCKSPYINRHEENQSAIIKNSNSVNPGLVDRNPNQNIQLNNQPNTEDLLKNGDTRNYLNKLAKSMIDNMKEFTSQSVEIFNGNIPNFTQESEHKQKVDNLLREKKERMRKLEILKAMKEKFFENNNL